jgi:cytochrome c5
MEHKTIKKTFKALLALGFISLIFSGCYYDNEEDLYPFYENNCDTTAVSYSLTVRTVLDASCVSCHQPSNPSGNVLLDTYQNVKTNADNGRLWGSINHDPGFVAMPQGGGSLSNCSLAQIKAWINSGSPNN